MYVVFDLLNDHFLVHLHVHAFGLSTGELDDRFDFAAVERLLCQLVEVQTFALELRNAEQLLPDASAFRRIQVVLKNLDADARVEGGVEG